MTIDIIDMRIITEKNKKNYIFEFPFDLSTFWKTCCSKGSAIDGDAY